MIVPCAVYHPVLDARFIVEVKHFFGFRNSIQGSRQSANSLNSEARVIRGGAITYGAHIAGTRAKVLCMARIETPFELGE